MLCVVLKWKVRRVKGGGKEAGEFSFTRNFISELHYDWLGSCGWVSVWEIWIPQSYRQVRWREVEICVKTKRLVFMILLAFSGILSTTQIPCVSQLSLRWAQSDGRFRKKWRKYKSFTYSFSCLLFVELSLLRFVPERIKLSCIPVLYSAGLGRQSQLLVS